MTVDVRAAIIALDKLMADLDTATRAGVSAGADRVQTLGRAYVPHTSGRGDGELAPSIVVTGPSPTGAVEYTALVGPTVDYGRIREIGGHIPGRKKVMTHPFLRWEIDGKPIFARKVYQHGAKYMLHAVEDVRPVFQNGIVAPKWASAVRRV